MGGGYLAFGRQDHNQVQMKTQIDFGISQCWGNIPKMQSARELHNAFRVIQRYIHRRNDATEFTNTFKMVNDQIILTFDFVYVQCGAHLTRGRDQAELLSVWRSKHRYIDRSTHRRHQNEL